MAAPIYNLHLKVWDLHRQWNAEFDEDHSTLLATMEGPVLLNVSFRGRQRTLACGPETPYHEFEDALTALFLTTDESLAGWRPVGLGLQGDVFVSLPAACNDLPLLGALSQTFRLLVSFPFEASADDNGVLPPLVCGACVRRPLPRTRRIGIGTR